MKLVASMFFRMKYGNLKKHEGIQQGKGWETMKQSMILKWFHKIPYTYEIWYGILGVCEPLVFKIWYPDCLQMEKWNLLNLPVGEHGKREKYYKIKNVYPNKVIEVRKNILSEFSYQWWWFIWDWNIILTKN